ncbi:MAG: ABC transporter substrate-binding protein [Corynebacteriales bacterium]|nr:ABC transporter substrate-binding protein [Mycobacteriales bacterium]
MSRIRTVVASVLCVATTVALSACSQSQSGERSDTFVFAGAAPPQSFDPIFTDNTDSFRVLTQMYDTLVTQRPGTAQLAPGLAEDWELQSDGTTMVLNLRSDVTFHDGTPFNADAVCFNFDRWFTMDSAAAQNNMWYYTSVWGGFKTNLTEGAADPLYKSCEAINESKAAIHFNQYSGAFPAALTLQSFSISSPAALRAYDADTVKLGPDGETFEFSDYARNHPVGTGPYKFKSFDAETGTTQLERFDDYWGENARVKNLEFRTIPESDKRKKALIDGDIDGYDLPKASDVEALEAEGHSVLARPSFNVMYMAINQGHVGKLGDIRVRRALMYAINRDELVQKVFPDEGATVANQLVPDLVTGYARDVTAYSYDPEQARALLTQANATNLTLKFAYPANAERLYLRNGKEVYESIASDLENVGIRIEPVEINDWGTYMENTRINGEPDLFLLGWQGDFNDPGNFLNSLLGLNPTIGVGDTGLPAAYASAASITDPVDYQAGFEQLSRDFMDDWLPVVPLAHLSSEVVVRSNVRGVYVSPFTTEKFASAYFSS